MPNLATTGVTYSGSMATIDGTDRATCNDATRIGRSQGWIAQRVRMGNIIASSDIAFFSYGTSADGIILYWRNGQWDARRAVSGAHLDLLVSATHAQGDDVTVIYAWTSTQLRVSVNGAAFATFSDSQTPTARSSWDIGYEVNAGTRANSSYHWFLAGSGTLTDTDAATIHGFGNTDPSWGSIPGTPTFLWAAESDAYLDAAPVANQKVYPVADVATTGWTTTPLWSKLDDLDDADYISGVAS